MKPGDLRQFNNSKTDWIARANLAGKTLLVTGVVNDSLVSFLVNGVLFENCLYWFIVRNSEAIE
jgi:membrane protein required for beta-lactamase induction